jgi:rod shape-determining protein MreB
MARKARSHLLALDLGSSVLRIAALDEQGQPTVINEIPALVLVTQNPMRVVAVGAQAATIGEASMPEGVLALHPIRQGVIAAFDPAVALIRAALQEALGGERGVLSLRGGPRAVFNLPATATEVERTTALEALRCVGIKEATPVPTGLAAGLGAGIHAARAQMVCNLGAGLVEATVLRNGQVFRARTWPLGGRWLTGAVARAVRRRRGHQITRKMAEQALLAAGDVDTAEGGRPRMDTGQLMQRVTAGGAFGELGLNPHTVSRLPEFNSEDMQTGLLEGTRVLFDQLLWFWEELPPEIRRTVTESGVLLTGGLVRLRGMADALARALHMPVRVVEAPEGATLRGLLTLAAAPAEPLPAWPWPPLWNNG